MRYWGFLIILCLLMSPNEGWAEENSHRAQSTWGATRNVIGSDYCHFYTSRHIGLLTAGLGIGVILAHTDADQEIRHWYQQAVRDNTTDEISRFVKPFGNGRITIPCYIGVALVGKMTENFRLGSLVKEWGVRSLRTLLVGVPPLLLLQNATGASRPTEADSRWRPFKDDNGVSGHSFMGAVPFLSAAMMIENFSLKTLFYTGSTLCGLSRVNDDKHYFSQVILGWWLAYLAAKSVHMTENQREDVRIMPMIWDHGIGIQCEILF